MAIGLFSKEHTLTSRGPVVVGLLICLSACTPEDGAFVAIDALEQPSSPSLGIPVRVTAVGGNGVRVEVFEGAFSDGERSDCITIGASRATLLTIHPDDIEALVIARLFESCEAAATVELASTQLTVRKEQPNSAVDGGVESPDAPVPVDAALAVDAL